MRFTIGTITQSHQLFIEMIVPHSNSSIAIDNVRLIDCFPGNYELLKIFISQQTLVIDFSYMWAMLKV